MKKLFIILLFVCVPVIVEAQTHLAVVTTTSPGLVGGQSAVLDTTSDGSGYGCQATCGTPSSWPTWVADGCNATDAVGYNVYEWSNKATYASDLIPTTPGTNGHLPRVYYMGGDHAINISMPPCSLKDLFIKMVYDVTSNTWSRAPRNCFDNLYTAQTGAGSIDAHMYGGEFYLESIWKFVYSFLGTNGLVADSTAYSSSSSFNDPDCRGSSTPTVSNLSASCSESGLCGTTTSGPPSTNNMSYGALQNFPDRNSILNFTVTTSIAHLWEKRVNSDTWNAVNDINTTNITVTGLSGSFSLTEVITGGTSGATAHVLTWDGTSVLEAFKRPTDNRTAFQVGEVITGSTSGAHATIATAVASPDWTGEGFSSAGGSQMYYSPVLHGTFLCCGGTSHIFWLNGGFTDSGPTVKQLDDYPTTGTTCNGGTPHTPNPNYLPGVNNSLQLVDATTGYLLVLSVQAPSGGANEGTGMCTFVINPNATSGTEPGHQWLELDGTNGWPNWETACSNQTITANTVYNNCLPPIGISNSGGNSSYEVSFNMATGMWDQGIDMICGYLNCWAMMLQTNTLAANGMSFDYMGANLPGEFAYIDTKHFSESLCQWDTTDTGPYGSNTVMVAAGYSPPPYSTDFATRLVGEGNCAAVGSIGPPVVPGALFIQNTIVDSRSGNTGAIEIPKWTNVEESSGQYIYNYNNILGYPAPSGNIYTSPTSPWGSTSYTQMSFRRDANDLYQGWRTDWDGDAHPLYGVTNSAGVNSAVLHAGASPTPGTFSTSWAGRGVSVYTHATTNGVGGLYTISSVASDGSTITLDRSPSTSGTALTNGYIDIAGDPQTWNWAGALSCAVGTGNITLTNTHFAPFQSGMVGGGIYFIGSTGDSHSFGMTLGSGYVGTSATVSSVTDSTHMVVTPSPCPSANGLNGYARMGDVQTGQKFFLLTGNAPYGIYNISGQTATVMNDTQQYGYLGMYETSDFGTIGGYGQSSAVPFGGDQFYTVTVREKPSGLYRYHQVSGGDTQIIADPIDAVFDLFFPTMTSNVYVNQNEFTINAGTGAAGDTILSPPVTTAGTGYTDGCGGSGSGFATTGGSGSGMLTCNVTDGSGHLVSVYILSGGQGNYIDGDVLTVGGGTGGQITMHGVRVEFRSSRTPSGSGYATASGVSLSGGHCVGTTADTVAVSGQLVAVYIKNPGVSCVPGDVLTVPGGTGGTVTVTLTDVYTVGSYVDTTHVYLATPPCPGGGACLTGQFMKGPYQASGRTTSWINGLTNMDTTIHAISWFDPHDPLLFFEQGVNNTYGVGRGQIEIAPQMTAKDPTQNNIDGGATINYYYGPINFSSFPPVANLGSGVTPPPPTTPASNRIRLRKGEEDFDF